MINLNTGFGSASVIRVTLLVLAVAVAVAIGTYGWQHSKVNSLTNKVNDLNTTIENLNSQVSILGAKLSQACQPPQQTSSSCANYVYSSTKGVSVLVYAPMKDSIVASPLVVVGEVPGNWSTEAQFPVQLKNDKGDVIAQSPAHLLGSWETSQLVPFSVQITYARSESGSGMLVLQKDNPSDLPKNSDSVSVPIRF